MTFDFCLNKSQVGCDLLFFFAVVEITVISYDTLRHNPK